MKALKGFLTTVVIWLIIGSGINYFAPMTLGMWIIGYFGTLAVIIIILKRIVANHDVVGVSKVITSRELTVDEFQDVVSITETKGFKYKSSYLKRSYLFFGDYVYTIKFTKP